MGRLRLGLSITLGLALAGPAGAAELTRLQSAEDGDPFALHLSVRWDREHEKATIAREKAVAGRVVDQDELAYERVKNDVVARIALALYRDLELHVDVPYALGDDTSWKLKGIPAASTILQETRDAMGQPCATSPCPLFPVATEETTVYKGGELGDVKVGLAWAIFNEARDDTKPTWVVGVDATLPTAKLYDPAEGRDAFMGSPYFAAAKRGPAGEKVWKWDLHTTLSRRVGPIDPYVRAHVTGMTRSSSTYSNCDRVQELFDDPLSDRPAQMTFAATQNCSAARWKDEARAKLPWIAGLTFGTELVPYEDLREDQKVSFDFRLAADYTSSSRFYNELTDLTGKLHSTGSHLTMTGSLGLTLRASQWVTLQALGSVGARTAHFLSGEPLGKDGDVLTCDPALRSGARGPGDTSCADLNPNYDWRYDAPGNRFRVHDVTFFSLTVAGVLQF